MGSADWGQQPSGFVQFDGSLDLLVEKTTRLAKFLSERAQAKIDYSKKLKEISQKHQQKYNSIKARSVCEQTTSKAFISILGQTLAAANREEQSARKLLKLISDTLARHEKVSAEKRASINLENSKYKQQLQDQQRRLQSAKNEHQKRKKEHEKAMSNWQKCKEKVDSSIQEQDKLRNASSDKEALAHRSRDELDRQTSIFNQQNGTYYDEQLPNLCRGQQRSFKELSDVWKNSLKEVVKIDIESISEANKANMGLLHDVDKIDRTRDSDSVFNSAGGRSSKNSNANNSGRHSVPPSTQYRSRASPDYVPPPTQTSQPGTPSASLTRKFDKLGLKKQNSRDTVKPDENVVNFDKIRQMESPRRDQTIQKLTEQQKEIIQTEERKQEGLKRLAASATDNNVTRGVQQQLIDSSMAIKQAQRNLEKLSEVTKRSHSDDNLLASSPRIRDFGDTRVNREPSRRNDRERKKRRETTGGIEFSWNRPGTSKHHRLTSLSTMSFPQARSTLLSATENDHFEPSDSSGGSASGTVIEKVKGEQRQEPDGNSQEGESEWDEMSVLETFARGRVLFDFDGDYPDLVCLHVTTDEVIEVSLRDDDGWTMARKLTPTGTVLSEGYIPTTYFEIIQ